MLAIPSTVQLLLTIVLVLLGVCGNLVVPFVSYRTALRCPHITVLAALDFTASLLGPGFMLVTIVMGPTWLKHNKTLCQRLSFLSSLVLITSFLVLFFLGVFCQNVQHHIPLAGKRRSKRGRYGFLAMCLLAGLLLGVQILLGWSVFNDLYLVPCCTFLTHAKLVPLKNSIPVYLVCSFVVLSILTIFLAVRAVKQRRMYPVKLLWERHKYEEKINDPEMTTVASISSSNQSHATIRSNRSYWSRRSSGRLSGIFSVVASPLVSRKSSRRHTQENVLLEVLWQAHLSVLRLPFAANGTNEEVGKEMSEMTSPAIALGKDVESTPSSTTSRSASTPPQDQAFVIPLHTPCNLPILPIRKRVFQSPSFLPQFKALQQQRSLSRLLLLQSCVTGLCWLPLYAAVVLLLSQVQYPQELHVFIQWLIFVPPSISPLFPLCDAGYRRVLRRAACSLLKTCTCGNQTETETAESRDVEFKVEGTQQVRLMAVRSLEIGKLKQTF